jgi:hypothetical protein
MDLPDRRVRRGIVDRPGRKVSADPRGNAVRKGPKVNRVSGVREASRVTKVHKVRRVRPARTAGMAGTAADPILNEGGRGAAVTKAVTTATAMMTTKPRPTESDGR